MAMDDALLSGWPAAAGVVEEMTPMDGASEASDFFPADQAVEDDPLEHVGRAPGYRRPSLAMAGYRGDSHSAGQGSGRSAGEGAPKPVLHRRLSQLDLLGGGGGAGGADVPLLDAEGRPALFPAPEEEEEEESSDEEGGTHVVPKRNCITTLHIQQKSGKLKASLKGRELVPVYKTTKLAKLNGIMQDLYPDLNFLKIMIKLDEDAEPYDLVRISDVFKKMDVAKGQLMVVVGQGSRKGVTFSDTNQVRIMNVAEPLLDKVKVEADLEAAKEVAKAERKAKKEEEKEKAKKRQEALVVPLKAAALFKRERGANAAEGSAMAKAFAKPVLLSDYKKSGHLWAVLQKLVFSPDRPFRQWTRLESLFMDVQILGATMGLALTAGIILVLLPFNYANLVNPPVDYTWTFAGVPMLGVAAGFYSLWWQAFFFLVNFSRWAYAATLAASLAVPLGLYALIVFTSAYPMPGGPLVMISFSYFLIYAVCYGFLPTRLREKPSFRQDILNSIIILGLMLVILLSNRLLVVNLVGQDAARAITLAFIYPVLVFRGTLDACKVVEQMSTKSANVVETFFVFLGALFKGIIYLGTPDATTATIAANIVNPWIIFTGLFGMDLLAVSIDPLWALVRPKNKELLEGGAKYGEKELFEKDPLRLKPMLLKAYATITGNIIFIVLVAIIRGSYSSAVYPFANGASGYIYQMTNVFLIIEIVAWVIILQLSEHYLRGRGQQNFIRDKKQTLLDVGVLAALTTTVITLEVFLEQSSGGAGGDLLITINGGTSTAAPAPGSS